MSDPTIHDKAEFNHWRKYGRGRPYGALRNRYPEQDERITELYAAGLSTREIGRIVGWSAGFVRDRLFRLGVELRPRGGSRVQPVLEYREITQWYMVDRLPVEEIAERLGVSTTTINRKLVKLGLRRKKLSGSSKLTPERRSEIARQAAAAREQKRGRKGLVRAA